MKCFFRGEILFMKEYVTNLVASIYCHEMLLGTLTKILFLLLFEEALKQFCTIWL